MGKNQIDSAALTRPSTVVEILKEYNVRPRHSLGQNFLVDLNVLSIILETAGLTREDYVLEVGPGIGTLTAALADRAARVCAVEMDKSLETVLERVLSGKGNIRLIFDDILRLDLDAILESANGGDRKWKVVSNLPYYITSPFLLRVIEHERYFSRLVLMVQWEVANRLTASSGTKDYGVTSVLVQHKAVVKVIRKVSAQSFFPPPEVSSAIVLMEMRDSPLTNVANMGLLRKVVNLAFGQRRKTIANALTSLIGKNEAVQLLGGIGISPLRRGETLTIQEFTQITNEIAKAGFQ